MNGTPGRASLQWADVTSDGGVGITSTTRNAMELEVRAAVPAVPTHVTRASAQVRPSPHFNTCPRTSTPPRPQVSSRNLVSRQDADPAPPTRVTHAAFSSDGRCLATVEVMPTLDGSDGDGSSALKMWAWSDKDRRFVLNTRVDSPHKAAVTALEFHPARALLVTASTDRTFKLWERVEDGPLVSIAHEAHVAAVAAAAKQRAAAADEADGARAAVRGRSGRAPAAADDDAGAESDGRAAAALAAVGRDTATSTTAAAAAAQEPQRVLWSCKSVGFYRDDPATSAAFSTDGSMLAVGYGIAVTLWDWRSLSLVGVLSHASRQSASEVACAAADAARAAASACPTAPTTAQSLATSPVTFLAFCGLSPYLASASATSLAIWNMLSLSCAWRYDGATEIVALAADRIGFATSTRLALVAAVSRSDYAVVTFDAASPEPLSVTSLPTSALAASYEPALLPPHGRASPYSVAFVPAAAARAAAAATAAVGGETHQQASGDKASATTMHALLVLGPLNERYVFAAPSDAPKPRRRQPQRLMAAATSVDLPTPVPTVTVVAPARDDAGRRVAVPTVAVQPLDMLRGGTTAAAAEAAPAPTAATSDSDFNSLLRSFGPTAALPSATFLFESLMGALLPPQRSNLSAAAVNSNSSSSSTEVRALAASASAAAAALEVPGARSVADEAMEWGLRVGGAQGSSAAAAVASRVGTQAVAAVGRTTAAEGTGSAASLLSGAAPPSAALVALFAAPPPVVAAATAPAAAAAASGSRASADSAARKSSEVAASSMPKGKKVTAVAVAATSNAQQHTVDGGAPSRRKISTASHTTAHAHTTQVPAAAVLPGTLPLRARTRSASVASSVSSVASSTRSSTKMVVEAPSAPIPARGRATTAAVAATLGAGRIAATQRAPVATTLAPGKRGAGAALPAISEENAVADEEEEVLAAAQVSAKHRPSGERKKKRS